MADDVIVARGLRKAYGRQHAIADVSLTVARGEIFGILGPNGAGKTTTVECLEGLRRPDSGSATVLGLDPQSQGQLLRQRIGAQLQSSALPPRLRVGEALELFSSLQRGGPPWPELLEQWSLTEQRRSSFADLSGGQRQRLLIALALVNAPELVFLDELTTGLDPEARRSAWALVERVRADGATVVLVTHFMDEAERLCDRLVVIDHGRVVAQGTPGQLVASTRGAARVEFSAAPTADLSFVGTVQGVEHVARDGPAVVVTGSGPLLARLAHALVEHGLVPNDLRGGRPSLEDTYLSLVGHADDGPRPAAGP